MPRVISNKQIIESQMNRLWRLVNNMLVENKNFKSGYYFNHSEYGRTYNYVRGPLKESAEYLLHEIEEIRELFIEMFDEENVAENQK